MPCFFCPSRFLRQFPVESCFKLLFLTIHVLGNLLFINSLELLIKMFFILAEIFTGIHMNPTGEHLMIEYENVHHICMLSGFIVGALVEILIYFGVPFPKKTEYMINFIAFLIQAMLMAGHLHGDMGLELMVHMLWSYVCILTLFAALLETFAPDNFWFVYARIYFFCVQGFFNFK